MKNFKWILIGIAVVALSSCGDDKQANSNGDSSAPSAAKIEDKPSIFSGKNFANTYLTEMDKSVSALEQVNDKSSAETAAKAIHEMNQTFEKMSEEINDGVALEQRIALAMVSRQADMIAIQQRMAMQMMRLQQTEPELLKMITEAMPK